MHSFLPKQISTKEEKQCSLQFVSKAPEMKFNFIDCNAINTIDFIRDINGHAAELEALLIKLGYAEANGNYAHLNTIICDSINCNFHFSARANMKLITKTKM